MGGDRYSRDNEVQRNPVAVSITTYESEAIERLPEGKGYFYADAAYDSRKVLNTVVDSSLLETAVTKLIRVACYALRILLRIRINEVEY